MSNKISSPRQSGDPDPPAESSSTTPFVIVIEAERFYNTRRHYWTICLAQKPDELLSWGYAPTRILAELAAGIVAAKLQSSDAVGGAAGPNKFRRR